MRLRGRSAHARSDEPRAPGVKAGTPARVRGAASRASISCIRRDEFRSAGRSVGQGWFRSNERRLLMAKVVAGITTSVDGYITGPNDGPGKGLGDGGERLHYWVFGGPWSYENEPKGEPAGEDADYLKEMMARVGAVVVGRNMYEAAGHWGDKNPFGVTVFVVTHRPEEEPESGEFSFVGGFDEAIDLAKAAAG